VKRWRGLASVVLLLVLGLAAGCSGTKHRAVVSPTKPDLLVASRWQWKGTEVLSGALGSEPKQGFVLFESPGVPPSLFTPSGGHGSIHLVAAGRFHWLFRSRDGWTSTLDFADGLHARYFDLGRALDPGHLPALPLHGAAIPIAYGPKQRSAVLLVGNVSGQWSLYGYLPGFQLPLARNPTQTLQRPLLGPHDALYRIDRRQRRLDRIGGDGKPARLRGPGEGCSTWPQPDGSRYLACPRTIKHVSKSGASQTVFSQPASTVSITWPFLAVSPGGRTLLLEEDESSCGTHKGSYFLTLGTGVLIPTMNSPLGLQTQIASTPFDSQPLGWLPEKGFEEALVAGLGAGFGDCADEPVGIYDVFPSGGSQIVAATNIGDATTW
jgi:hypothetical protein